VNPDAWWMADVWYCVVCGQPCGPDDWDNDGNPIHEQCAIDRLAAMMDRGKDERMGTD
jgi:hypothetical protein